MNIPIDWATVEWRLVATLSLIAFVASLLGTLLSLGNRLFGPVLTAILFGALYVLWTYWLRAEASTRFGIPL